MDCWIVIRAFSSEVGTGSREENASKREAGAGHGSKGRKLQNFAAGSYSLTCIVRVFHAPRRKIDHARMTGIPPEHNRSGKPQLTCRGHAPKTRQRFQRVNA
jgi:hypothetical protein